MKFTKKTTPLFLHGAYIVALFCLLGLSVIILWNNSVAWFAKNKDVSADGIKASVYHEDVYADYYVYMYDLNDQIGTDLDEAGNELTISNLTFHPYDLIFINRNRFTPVVVRIGIHGTDVPEEGTIVIALDRNAANGEEEGKVLNELSKYSSSVLRVTAASGPKYYATKTNTEGEIVPDANAIYDRAVNGIDEFKGIGDRTDTETRRFTTTTPSGTDDTGVTTYTYTKADTLTFEVTYTAADFIVNDTEKILNLYLLLEYDAPATDTGDGSTLIEHFSKTHAPHVATGGILDNRIPLENDLSYISVGVKKADTAE